MLIINKILIWVVNFVIYKENWWIWVVVDDELGLGLGLGFFMLN